DERRAVTAVVVGRDGDGVRVHDGSFKSSRQGRCADIQDRYNSAARSDLSVVAFGAGHHDDDRRIDRPSTAVNEGRPDTTLRERHPASRPPPSELTNRRSAHPARVRLYAAVARPPTYP